MLSIQKIKSSSVKQLIMVKDEENNSVAGLNDIKDRHDIEKILSSFYEQAFKDELIGRFFTEVVPLDLKTHLPVITDFWEAVLFNTHSYRKNVMDIHRHIHELSPINKTHLDRWVQIFHTTIDRFYMGEKATLMKQRGQSIAGLMDVKLNYKQINKL